MNSININNIPSSVVKKIAGLPFFQRQVYLACATIPKGEVRTYQWIARKIHRPNAARAVGTALAKNPFAPVIPCHRVIRSDGKLGGYSGRGGLQSKVKLLKEEGYKNL